MPRWGGLGLVPPHVVEAGGDFEEGAGDGFAAPQAEKKGAGIDVFVVAHLRKVGAISSSTHSRTKPEMMKTAGSEEMNATCSGPR